MPFKTKLVPNWQMDWGKKYEKATYPTREKQQVQLFDILGTGNCYHIGHPAQSALTSSRVLL